MSQKQSSESSPVGDSVVAENVGNYRKRPVVIEAVHYDGGFPLAFLRGDERVRSAGDGTGALEILTLEGVMRGDIGDYIIRGVKGELYPCKPDIFEATYEAVGNYTEPVTRATPKDCSCSARLVTLTQALEDLLSEVFVDWRTRPVSHFTAPELQARDLLEAAQPPEWRGEMV